MIDDAEYSRIQAHVAAITQTPEYIALKARVDALRSTKPVCGNDADVRQVVTPHGDVGI